MPTPERRGFLDRLRLEADGKIGGVRSLDDWALKAPAPGIVHVLEERFRDRAEAQWKRRKQDDGGGLDQIPGATDLIVRLRVPA